ncbi:nicotine blue oxidoreductase [Friedmanniella luteola]|uniref:Nicotine blue oxidoreductase n=1 Tax=Friedmanniella luteola TaxID=546871 RepID=A0A1H1VBH6_9ACTN|nr:NTP transferase domain-containing protein [Friedmanniella luteola]SDS82108.1 nicotine blue oxidoreductase [Friedmanniella luteola]
MVGLLLAAGAGRRAGGPKALRRDADGTPWLSRAVRVLADGGCAPVVVVLGCAAPEAAALLAAHPLPGADVRPVTHPGWADGLAGSLRCGLDAAAALGAAAVVVHLVDLPDVGADVVRRLLTVVPPEPEALARAGYHGRPGHPVLVGRAHLPALRETVSGDAGAQAYLSDHDALVVACDDLAGGHDVDEPAGNRRA